MEGNRDRQPSSSPNRSPLSPFPFGSPITFSDRSLLTPLRRLSGDNPVSSLRSSSMGNAQTQHIFRGKVRAQEVYGGPLLFGGTSSLRKNRLLSASPYDSPASHRFSRFSKEAKSNTSNASTPSTSKSTTPISEDGMSSSVRSILETLERMSTPVRDAQKIPIIPRAEKRRQVMLELDSGLVQTGQAPSLKRRRPNLSSKGATPTATRALLNGPPLRTLRSPASATAKPASGLTSARINFSAMQTNCRDQSEVSPASSTTCTVSNSVTALSSVPKLSAADSGFSIPKTDHGSIVPALRPFSMSTSIASNYHPTPPENNNEEVSLGSSNNKKSTEVINSLPSATTSLNAKWSPNIGAGFFKNLLASNNQSTTTSEANFQAFKPSVSPPETLASSLSSGSSKTTDTLILSPTRKSFSFSNPIPVTQSSVELKGLTGNSQKSRRFSFCDPHVVSNVKKAEVATGAKPVANSFTQMPDLTSGPAFAANLQEKSSYQAASTLKAGSVLDILGGNHKLPDVTGITNTNPVKSLGTSAWVSSEKIGSKSWT